jgi:hypothetical protein
MFTTLPYFLLLATASLTHSQPHRPPSATPSLTHSCEGAIACALEQLQLGPAEFCLSLPPTHSLTHSHTPSLPHSLPHSLTQSSFSSLTSSFSHSHTHSLANSTAVLSVCVWDFTCDHLSFSALHSSLTPSLPHSLTASLLGLELDCGGEWNVTETDTASNVSE